MHCIFLFMILLFVSPCLSMERSSLCPLFTMNENEASLFLDAVDEGKVDVVQRLLDAGANPHIVDARGRLPLTQAILTHNVPMLQVILDAGADANQPRGLLPLKEAITVSHDDDKARIVRMLIQAGADQHHKSIVGGLLVYCLENLWESYDSRVIHSLLKTGSSLDNIPYATLIRKVFAHDLLLVNMILGNDIKKLVEDEFSFCQNHNNSVMFSAPTSCLEDLVARCLEVLMLVLARGHVSKAEFLFDLLCEQKCPLEGLLHEALSYAVVRGDVKITVFILICLEKIGSTTYKTSSCWMRLAVISNRPELVELFSSRGMPYDEALFYCMDPHRKVASIETEKFYWSLVVRWFLIPQARNNSSHFSEIPRDMQEFLLFHFIRDALERERLAYELRVAIIDIDHEKIKELTDKSAPHHHAMSFIKNNERPKKHDDVERYYTYFSDTVDRSKDVDKK